jgi:hypothetical protein
MESVNYNNGKLRIGAALVAAVYIVLHGRFSQYLEAITSLSFYIAVAVSFIFALLLVFLIHKITIWLDKRHIWRREPIKRFLLQLIFGLIAPVFLDISLISIYFKITERDIFKTDFFLVDLPVVVAFLTILNLYYLIHYLLLTEQKSLISLEEESTVNNEEEDRPILTIQYSGQNIVLDADNDILFFYRSGRLTKVVTINGKEYPTNYSLIYLIEHFQSANFFRINRSVIINLNFVTGYVAGVKRDTIQINFKPQYYEAIQNQDRDLFKVTKENIADFKNIFTGK